MGCGSGRKNLRGPAVREAKAVRVRGEIPCKIFVLLSPRLRSFGGRGLPTIVVNVRGQQVNVPSWHGACGVMWLKLKTHRSIRPRCACRGRELSLFVVPAEWQP
ncbi:hypothetical protein EVAR_76708_1 [Eumeta japonica]|uniref:Uncharacterized protein n=1 Tax=Eumeta variegata TaxID=151549 RepID=A0A4C1STJ8_EUMVA|nr:hypothetical protein EVAR_76708_1 [Eumeta japonica]